MTIPEAALQWNIINIQAVPETEYCPKLFVITISFSMKDGGQMEQTTTKTAATTQTNKQPNPVVKHKNMAFEVI